MANQSVIDRLRAFTLLEMSIALLVIGLLVGTVLKARETLELQAIVTEMITTTSQIANASYDFRTKYGTLPGDYQKDFTFLGNGNGFIDITGLYTGNERLGAFVQLNESGFYTGTFDSNWLTVGTRLPNGPIKNTAFYFQSYFLYNGVGNTTANVISLSTFIWVDPATNGGQHFQTNISTWGTSVEAPALTPKMIYLIDRKIDDGLSTTGTIRGFSIIPSDTSVGECASSTTVGNYETSNNKSACIFYYFL